MSDRDWNFNMDEAPKHRIIEVAARYPDATAGSPRYVGWSDGFVSLSLKEPRWYEFSRSAPVRVIPWAWRERTDWPEEPRTPQ